MPARAYIYEPSEKDRKAGKSGQLLFDGKPFPYYITEAPKVSDFVPARGWTKHVTLTIPVFEVVYSISPILEDESGRPLNFAKLDHYGTVLCGDREDYPPLVDPDLDLSEYV